MRILEIIPQLNSGGAERFVVDLCNELCKTNDVTLVVFHKVQAFRQYYDELDKKINFICLDKKEGADFSLYLKISKIIKQIKPHVVHSHLSAIVYTSLSSMLFKKAKYIHTVHNDAAIEAEHGLNRSVRKLVFKFHTIHPVTISEISKQSFIDLYHEDSTMIYNGSRPYTIPDNSTLSEIKSEIQSLKYNNDAISILNVARIQPQKNQVSLAKAIVNLNNKGYKVELFNIGKPAEQNMVNEIMALNSNYVHLLGVKTNPRDYMLASDAFCLSSLYEGMPITLIECFSVGAIPICTPVGGIKNMILDSENGILAKDCSQEEIEQAIIRFLEMPLVIKSIIKSNSKESFKQYEIQTTTYKYIELMNLLCNNN